MSRQHRTLRLAALLLVSTSSLPAQAAANPSGHWEGTIQAPDRGYNIGIDLAQRAGGGGLVATFDNLDDNERGLPLSNVAVDGRSVRFLIKGTSGGTFDGVLSADGKSITGNFTTTTGAHSLPFNLTRTGEPKIEPPPKSAPIGKELEGTWTGNVHVDGVDKRLVLTLSNQTNGTSTGSILSAEGLEIPITSISQKGSNLTLDVKLVAGTYAGTLSPQGTELVGTWTQGSLVVPLTFTRATRP